MARSSRRFQEIDHLVHDTVIFIHNKKKIEWQSQGCVYIYSRTLCLRDAMYHNGMPKAYLNQRTNAFWELHAPLLINPGVYLSVYEQDTISRKMSLPMGCYPWGFVCHCDTLSQCFISGALLYISWCLHICIHSSHTATFPPS